MNKEYDLLVENFRKILGTSTKKTEQKIIDFIYDETKIKNLQDNIKILKDKFSICNNCFAINYQNYCIFCNDPQYNPHIICVVSSFQNLKVINKIGIYSGQYHVLNDLIKPNFRNKTLEYNIDQLSKRLIKKINEVIIALPATAQGEFTTEVLKRVINKTNPNIKITQLAKGIPVGGSLDYIDPITLEQAIKNRKKIT